MRGNVARSAWTLLWLSRPLETGQETPMQEEEWLLETNCMICGVELDPAADRAFLFGETGVLCFDCAIERGGEYDSEQDRWVKAPDVGDLPDERRPHP